MTTWASRISGLRGKGMTLREIGEEIGLSPSAVSDIEQGRNKSPNGEAALKLDALHTLKCKRPVPRTSASCGR